MPQAATCRNNTGQHKADDGCGNGKGDAAEEQDKQAADYSRNKAAGFHPQADETDYTAHHQDAAEQYGSQ